MTEQDGSTPAMHYAVLMSTPTVVPVPTRVTVRLPEDAAALLHRLAYETGRSKQALIAEALRRTYGTNPA
jgi:hypothetical protein